MIHLPFSKNLRLLFVLTLFLFSVGGCQGFQPKNPGELALKNHDFIEFWNAYNNCRSGSITQNIQKNLEILRTAPTPISLEDSPIPIPKFIKELTGRRNSRLAVDPRAMAASCSIHLAEVFRQTSDWKTSFQTYQSIVENFPEPQYAYYALEASRALEELSTVRPASLSSHDSLVH